VGISDTILKKPGKLDDQEFAIMKFHCLSGARFFENSTSDLDVISAEIALNHHERWDGRGYPGKIDNLYGHEVRMGDGKQAGEIPIYARIVALADVYDALISRRAYKEPFPEEKTLQIIKEESGRHFDPEVVEAFLSIYEVIVAIREKYHDESS
jgi:response regulator RpfG family c-di-GMP phosphodiesterase